MKVITVKFVVEEANSGFCQDVITRAAGKNNIPVRSVEEEVAGDEDSDWAREEISEMTDTQDCWK